MAEMDGYALMRQIRTSSESPMQQIPAIALTAFATEIDSQQILKAGFQRHIAKPVEPDTLVQEIAELLKIPPTPRVEGGLRITFNHLFFWFYFLLLTLHFQPTSNRIL
ncbi:multi-sensor hybrid histidine kinase [Calothrix sp. NIES-4071]|nr:multi-sensor hybrid histidine kinase [Calothrix sp. NIES-4071]BAZ62347.1 multi-sensor hybrid histidine kinase [Calothrix sp. NIES-4105]